MSAESCQLTVSLSVEVDFKSLEEIGIYVNNYCWDPNQRVVLVLTGDISDLGSWNPEKGILCKLKDGEHFELSIWNCKFTTQVRHTFRYRYFVAELKENNDEYSDSNLLKVLAWESRLEPRTFSLIDYINAVDKSTITHVKFGSYDDGIFIQRGWLISNSELHIRLSASACKFYTPRLSSNANSRRQLFISCSKYVVEPSYGENDDIDSADCDATVTRMNDPSTNDLVASRRRSASTGWLSFTPHARARPVLLSTLEINRCRIHQGENKECWGTLYKPGDEVTFYIETADIENTAVIIEFYGQELMPTPKDALRQNVSPLNFVGSARFGPFDGTCGRKASQILSSKQLPIGDLRVNYLVIHPMAKAPTPSLAVTYQHHWTKRGPVEIGHRGMGSSFIEDSQKSTRKPATIKENTLDSFRTAVQHGADFVEMDVQLTKDHQVIVYHDYEAVIISRKKRGGRLSYLPIAIKDLNYEDLRELKVHHSSVLRESHTHEKMDEDDLDPIELQSFPLLRSCFEGIDPDLGFVIEIKYPMELKAGGSEMSNFFEYNFYVDTILREILAHAKARRILLSCFDPNVCIMLQLKQNIYPVFQLGIAPEYADSRQGEFQRLFWSALSHQLRGVCLDSERVLQAPDVIKLAHLHNLVVLAWGEAVNCAEKRAQLIALGVDGIIYDRMHEHREKGTLSIFKQRPTSSPSSTPLFKDEIKSGLAHSSGNAHGDILSTSNKLPEVLEPHQLQTRQPYGPTHVAVVKECLPFERLSLTDSTTTCESIPLTTMSGFTAHVSASPDDGTEEKTTESAISATYDRSNDLHASSLPNTTAHTEASSARQAMSLISIA